MHFLDQSLADANFTTKDILNFLYTGPEEWREPGMAGFDWRNVFNGADQLIRLFNQYGEVSFPGLALESHSLLPIDKKVKASFPISCLSRLFCPSPRTKSRPLVAARPAPRSADRCISLLRLLSGDCGRASLKQSRPLSATIDLPPTHHPPLPVQ